MGLDRAERDVQFAGDLAIGQALGYGSEDLLLPAGELPGKSSMVVGFPGRCGDVRT